MIETPAAALLADSFAEEADFLSVGTNDLVQFTLAVDRDIDEFQQELSPSHPAILRLLKTIATAALERDKPVVVCGEIASMPLYIEVLLGLGYRALSMRPKNIPLCKRMIQNMDTLEAQSLAARMLMFQTAEEVEHHLNERIRNRFPEIFPSA